MKVVGALLAVAAPIAVRAQNNGGNTNCKCLDAPTDGTQKATQATGKPSYPTEADAYGYGCAQHDKDEAGCNVTEGAQVGAGQADDWCVGTWCIVDPATCNFRSQHVSYTGQADDFSSYEACDLNFGTDTATFVGNSWVGRCKNCEHMETGGDRTGASFEESFCKCGGPDSIKSGCPCLSGVFKATQASGKPEYPTETPSYGYGCKPHDSGALRPSGSDICANETMTGVGEANDWCEDEWCMVDPANCDLRSLHVSYTGAVNDFFSYEACDDGFAGNGWVGRCKNCEHVETGGDRTGSKWQESFCSCGGTTGCPCIKGVFKATQASGKPEYPTETPSYGYGCKAHDSGALRPSGSDICANETMTGVGEDNDWCEDKWCIVDKDNCDLTNVLLSGYTGDTTDYFTYLACDTSFVGNGWVGRCEGASGWNTDNPCTTAAPTAAPTAPSPATAAPTAAPTAPSPAAPSPATTDTDSASKAIPALICGAVFAAVAAF